MSSPVYLNFYNVNFFSGFTSRYSSPLRWIDLESVVLFIYINWWSLTIFYIKNLELSSSLIQDSVRYRLICTRLFGFWRLQHFLAYSVCLCWVRNRLLWSLQFIRIDQISSFSVIIE